MFLKNLFFVLVFGPLLLMFLFVFTGGFFFLASFFFVSVFVSVCVVRRFPSSAFPFAFPFPKPRCFTSLSSWPPTSEMTRLVLVQEPFVFCLTRFEFRFNTFLSFLTINADL